jgi:hypothetical protein
LTELQTRGGNQKNESESEIRTKANKERVRDEVERVTSDVLGAVEHVGDIVRVVGDLLAVLVQLLGRQQDHGGGVARRGVLGGIDDVGHAVGGLLGVGTQLLGEVTGRGHDTTHAVGERAGSVGHLLQVHLNKAQKKEFVNWPTNTINKLYK